MSETILVMGAGGRLGHAAAEGFRDAGWRVKSLVRPGRGGHAPRGTEIVEVVTRDSAVEAAQGCAVVLNALNPVLTLWEKNAMSLAYSAIAAAEGSGATLIFPGNLYNYGRGMPAVLDEQTPMHPTTRKGRMRVEMEQRMKEAADRGVRTVILRAGDFFGAGRGSWFDLVVAKELKRNRITYPGPFDVPHEWTYLPDYVATLIQLAERRDQLPPFEVFGFPGHVMTGGQVVAAIEAATRRRFNVRRMSWWMLKSFGQLMALGRELTEVEYLWRVPHRIDGDKLRAFLGEVPHTPTEQAVAAALRELGLA